MKWVRFSKYTAGDLGIDPQALMHALAPFFLNSGFASPYLDWNPNTLEALKQAIREVLESGELFPEDSRDEMLERLAAMSPEEVDELLNNLVRMLMEEGHISLDDQVGGENRQGEGDAGGEGQTRFEVTDKSLDFLGYKALKDLLGSLGKSSFGRHDTRDLATGIDASGSSRQYEFGDTLNLDVNATLFAAIGREGLKVPISLEYSDLHVHQSEYQSSCATVLMLDCSHSMILYGEDRFTPG